MSIGLINDPSRPDMDFGRGRARDPNAKPAPPVAPITPAAPGTPAPAAAGGGGEGGGAAITVQRLPLIKPPYGRITAIDLNKGEIVWQVPHGDMPDVVKNHPALKGIDIPRTGRSSGRIGTLVTRPRLP